MSETDVLKMKVADLKRELKLRGLSSVGNKTELQERLQTAFLDGDLSLEDATISEELLDEEVLTDEEEKAALESPQEDKCLLEEKKIEEQTSSNDTTNQQAKKVVLKRKSSLTTSSSASSTNSATITAIENAAPPEKIIKIVASETIDERSESDTNSNTEAKKVVKLSELSMKERLEMRAKKFGITVKDTTGDKIETPVANNEKESQQIQALKKRAERFGCVVSSKIAQIEIQEKMQKRQERFGSSTNNNSSTGVSKDAYAEKARLRLERFKAK